MFKVKLRKADKLFSRYIKLRDKWTCQSCLTKYPESSQGLHCSHYFSRARESVRFEPDNCCALCFYHHQLWGHGDGRDEYKEFMIKKLGQKRFDTLTIQANTYQKRDDKLNEIYLKELLKRQGYDQT